MAKGKGTKISSRLAFLKEVYGEALAGKVISVMPAEDYLSLNAILNSSWYPIDSYKRLVIAICKIAAGGDESVSDKIGRPFASHVLQNTY